jgi:predicted small lipoprotein YifL
MRHTHSIIAAVLVAATLAACGTKTPLSLPPPAQSAPAGAVAPAPTPAPNHGNMAGESRR